MALQASVTVHFSVRKLCKPKIEPGTTSLTAQGSSHEARTSSLNRHFSWIIYLSMSGRVFCFFFPHPFSNAVNFFKINEFLFNFDELILDPMNFFQNWWFFFQIPWTFFYFRWTFFQIWWTFSKPMYFLFENWWTFFRLVHFSWKLMN